jgi:hypothetical protein
MGEVFLNISFWGNNLILGLCSGRPTILGLWQCSWGRWLRRHFLCWRSARSWNPGLPDVPEDGKHDVDPNCGGKVDRLARWFHKICMAKIMLLTMVQHAMTLWCLKYVIILELLPCWCQDWTTWQLSSWLVFHEIC